MSTRAILTYYYKTVHNSRDVTVHVAHIPLHSSPLRLAADIKLGMRKLRCQPQNFHHSGCITVSNQARSQPIVEGVLNARWSRNPKSKSHADEAQCRKAKQRSRELL